MSGYYPVVWIYHTLFMHSSADGRLGCFPLLAIVNKNKQIDRDRINPELMIARAGILGCLPGMRFPFGVTKMYWD